jgi:hypothetical protein
MNLLSKYLDQTPERRRLLIEASWQLLRARLLLRWIPFRRLADKLNRPGSGAELQGKQRVQVREEVAWAIQRVADHLPGKTVCFPRAIAAHSMLYRRGVFTTLYYGAGSNSQGSLIAHVWVQDGAVGVVGMPEPYTFRVVARYPEVV